MTTTPVRPSRRPASPLRLLGAVVCLAGATVACHRAAACETPVYRYALYNWEPSPYHVYYLHRGKVPADQRPIHEALARLKSAQPAANVEFQALDLDAKPDSDPSARRSEAVEIAADYADEAPLYVVVNPHHGVTYTGALSADDVSALARSPVRDQIYAELAAGKAGVIVLLRSAAADKNDAARKQIRVALDAAAAGEIDLPSVPSDGERLGGKDNDTSDAERKPDQPRQTKFDVGFVEVDRDDERERWLVRALLHVEEDLEEETEPMAFAVFGRGRVAPPCVGAGIDQEQLRRMIAFVLGPCACTVKRDNPGGDLLVAYDWRTAAVAMAKRHGPETGNEQLLGGEGFPNLFPEIIDAPPLTPRAKFSEALAIEKPDLSVQPHSGQDQASPPSTSAPRPTSATTGAAAAAQGLDDTNSGSATSDPRLPATQLIGFGILVGVLCLALATLVMLRKAG